ncbi:MAG: tetratricopeptide repeat protein [Tannerellaceae bacterium]|jgi:tetratricopeptide (TPR) repeat protein|nr:tetratricopeptide repeat protein [Tannerellaceae bacterium]
MKKDDYSTLLQRYLSAQEKGTEAYFDVDEILYLLDCFEDEHDLTHYEGVLATGLRFYPDNDDIKIKACRSLTFKNKYEEALELSADIKETNNQELDAIRLECYFSMERFEDGYNYLDERVLDTSCYYVEDLFEHVATFLNDQEMLDVAETFVRFSLIGYPDNIILNNELCYICEMKGDMEEAIQICNTILDRSPYSYDFWFTLGRLYSLSNEYEKAIDAFEFACTCEDADADLLILKAYCLFMNENYEKAIDAYKQISFENADITDHIQSLIAECHIKLEEFEQGYLLLKDIIRKNNDSAEANTYINYIRCCVETDREQEAASILLRAAKLFPKNVRILALLALMFLENGEEDMILSATDKFFEQLKKHQKRVSLKEMIETMNFGKQENHLKMFRQPVEYIPLDELTKECLNNKTNNN